MSHVKYQIDDVFSPREENGMVASRGGRRRKESSYPTGSEGSSEDGGVERKISVAVLCACV